MSAAAMTERQVTWLRYKLQPIDRLADLDPGQQRRLWLEYDVHTAIELDAITDLVVSKASAVLAEHGRSTDARRRRLAEHFCRLLDLRRVVGNAQRVADDLDANVEADYLTAAVTAAVRLLHVVDDNLSTEQELASVVAYLDQAESRIAALAASRDARRLARMVRAALRKLQPLAPELEPGPVEPNHHPLRDQIAARPLHANAPPAVAHHDHVCHREPLAA